MSEHTQDAFEIWFPQTGFLGGLGHTGPHSLSGVNANVFGATLKDCLLSSPPLEKQQEKATTRMDYKLRVTVMQNKFWALHLRR